MRVKVQPMNMKGRPLFKEERDRRELYIGELKVHEVRVQRFGRVLTEARVVDVIDAVETAVPELYDVALLWADAKRLRMRGFEISQDTQYAQVWDIEVL